MHLPVISTVSSEGSAGAIRAYANATPATGPWPAADLAIYVPIVIKYPFVVRRVFWVNGTTATGNVDCGIYTAAGVKITSTGTTAQAGTSATQSVALAAEYRLSIGTYYLGLALSSATGTTFRAAPGIPVIALMGCAQEAGATTLPATMTPATIANDYLPVFGITSRTLI
jgi:hypothetical protein